MAHTYRLVGWNRQKRIYDLALVLGIVLYLVAFAAIALITHPEITAETLLIRGFGTLAFLMLNVVLSIGPLARLDRRFLPLLYNRRHFGVATFLVGVVHAVLSLIQFHSWGDLSPFVSVLVSNGAYSNLAFFPFQILGLAALVILFLLAATSHDFWLENLGTSMWKALHMAVYLAYFLLIGHIVLGTLQAETHFAVTAVVVLSAVWIGGLHTLSGWLGRRTGAAETEGWVEGPDPDSIADGGAKIVSIGGERVAVFRAGNQLSALSNVCAHQGGPVGEGRVSKGCAVCPWHGYEYQLNDGTSPPPFEERISVHRLRVDEGKLQIESLAQPLGTEVPPLQLESTDQTSDAPFYIGYQDRAPRPIARFIMGTVFALLTFSTLLGGALAAWQDPFDVGQFDFGVETDFHGLVLTDPVPHFWGRAEDGDASMAYLLVTVGKHGVDADFEHSQSVSITGSLIESPLGRMIEVHSWAASEAAPSEQAPPLVDSRTMTLQGEIVDSKCHLGVMKPGRRKPHRACATLCIRGGIPAMLRTDGPSHARGYVLFLDRKPFPDQALLDRVAEPVAVEGTVQRRGDLHFLRIHDKDAVQRLHPHPEERPVLKDRQPEDR